MDAIIDKLEATQEFVIEQIRTLRAELLKVMEDVGRMEERISINLRSTMKRKFSDRIEHMRSEIEDRMDSIAEKIMRRAPTDDDDDQNDDRPGIASPVAEPGSDPVVPPSVDTVDTLVASASAAPVASPVTTPTSARRVIDLEDDGDDRDERQTEFVIARKRSDDDDDDGGDSDEIPQSQFDNSDLQPYRHHQHALDALNQDQAALVLLHVEDTMSLDIATNDIVWNIMQDALKRRLWSRKFQPPGIKNTLFDYLHERVKNTRSKIRKQAEIARLSANLDG